MNRMKVVLMLLISSIYIYAEDSQFEQVLNTTKNVIVRELYFNDDTINLENDEGGSLSFTSAICTERKSGKKYYAIKVNYTYYDNNSIIRTRSTYIDFSDIQTLIGTIDLFNKIYAETLITDHSYAYLYNLHDDFEYKLYINENSKEIYIVVWYGEVYLRPDVTLQLKNSLSSHYKDLIAKGAK